MSPCRVTTDEAFYVIKNFWDDVESDSLEEVEIVEALRRYLSIQGCGIKRHKRGRDGRHLTKRLEVGEFLESFSEVRSVETPFAVLYHLPGGEVYAAGYECDDEYHTPGPQRLFDSYDAYKEAVCPPLKNSS